ncbi:MAG: hypothetical protein ACRCTG_11050 [Aestuariivirga sp.]
MEQQIMKGVRLSAPIIRRIELIAEEEQSTFSQFMRTAAINELKRKESRLGKAVNA